MTFIANIDKLPAIGEVLKIKCNLTPYGHQRIKLHGFIFVVSICVSTVHFMFTNPPITLKNSYLSLGKTLKVKTEDATRELEITLFSISSSNIMLHCKRIGF